jgi:hypothetical protein
MVATSSRPEAATGYRYVESVDGRRVYWGFLYKGCGAHPGTATSMPGITAPLLIGHRFVGSC